MCWTTWAVATLVAEGVGRLRSRSKWGRYRPKNGFLLRPFLRSVADYLGSFLASSGAQHWKTGRNPRPKTPLGRLGAPEGILFCRPGLPVLVSAIPCNHITSPIMTWIPERTRCRKPGARNR